MRLDKYLATFPYTAKEVIEQLQGLGNMKVLVIGDTIIDQYHYCSIVGKSPKDNIMVAKYLSEESFAGGVLAVANHIAGFCKAVNLVTCLGNQNSQESFIRQRLRSNIVPAFFYREDAPTIVKRRYVEPLKMSKLFGVSFLDDFPLPVEVSDTVSDYLQGVIDNFDLIVVADFGHGFMDEQIAEEVYEAKFLAVNIQTNSENAGFNLATKYYGMDYLCVDAPEMRLAYQNKFASINELVQFASESLGCERVAVTHGQNDTIMYNGGIYYIPVFSQEVKDTTGAGDAFLSITSPCVAKGYPTDMVGFIGNAVGALKVKSVCNRSPIEPDQLYDFIRELLNGLRA